MIHEKATRYIGGPYRSSKPLPTMRELEEKYPWFIKELEALKKRRSQG